MKKKKPLMTLDSPRELLELLDYLLCTDLEDEETAIFARGLLSILREKGLKFQDPEANGDDCVLCLHFSLMDALYKVEEMTGVSLPEREWQAIAH